MINIVIPMAGKGSRFKDAGYVFPKPLIDVKGKTMIEVVARNLRPKSDYRFVFICQRDHVKEYDLYNILKNATDGNFEIVQIDGITAGAACTVLCATPYIDDENEMLIANSDQFIDIDINGFLAEAQHREKDGLIMTFEASHPKWSYVRTNKDGLVVEVAEKKVISNQATVGLYYFAHGKDFVTGAQEMIKKDVRYNNEFYVCPVYNELILDGKKVYTYPIDAEKMHGLGTPEDLELFLRKIETDKVSLP
jgi:NDP-sugar pyrophosphorylase family protein